MSELEKIEIIRIKKTDINFKNIEWIIKAKSCDKSRFVLTHICVNKQEIVATDGRRMHIIKDTCGLDEGLYSVLLKNKSNILLEKSKESDEFPKYKAVYPIEPHKKINARYTDRIEYVLFDLFESFKNCVSIDYLKDAFNYPYFTWDKICCREKDTQLSPILFKSEEREAIVMPLKIDINERN